MIRLRGVLACFCHLDYSEPKRDFQPTLSEYQTILLYSKFILLDINEYLSI